MIHWPATTPGATGMQVKTCISCHKGYVNSYTHSNHYKTSSAVTGIDLKKRTALIEGPGLFYGYELRAY